MITIRHVLLLFVRFLICLLLFHVLFSFVLCSPLFSYPRRNKKVHVLIFAPQVSGGLLPPLAHHRFVTHFIERTLAWRVPTSQYRLDSKPNSSAKHARIFARNPARAGASSHSRWEVSMECPRMHSASTLCSHIDMKLGRILTRNCARWKHPVWSVLAFWATRPKQKS